MLLYISGDSSLSEDRLLMPLQLRRYLEKDLFCSEITSLNFWPYRARIAYVKQACYQEYLIPIHHQELWTIRWKNYVGTETQSNLVCFKPLPDTIPSNLDIYVLVKNSIPGHFSIKFDIDQPLRGLMATLALAVNIKYPNPYLDAEIPFEGSFALTFAGNLLISSEMSLKSYGISNGSKLLLRWSDSGAIATQPSSPTVLNQHTPLNDTEPDYFSSMTNKKSLISRRLGGVASSLHTFFTAPTGRLKPESRLSPFLEKVRQMGLIQDNRYDWSGRGQFAEFAESEDVPLDVGRVLGHSHTAIVQEVKCRRIKLARKKINCSKMSLEDAMVEASHLQKLNHPHIIQFIGAYLQGSKYSILLYPVADMNLQEFLVSEQIPYPEKEKFLSQAFYCAAHALNHCHRRTTRHMDIKPSNFLVKLVGSSYRLYLADFDVAQDFALEEQSQTASPRRRTPLYCSPEAAQGLPKGRSSDVFSLGCVYSEMLTVLMGKSLEDFASIRKIDGSTAFHGNLPAVIHWLEILPNPFIDPDNCSSPFFVIALTLRMLNVNPTDRPISKDILVKLETFFTLKHNCCTSEREKLQADY